MHPKIMDQNFERVDDNASNPQIQSETLIIPMAGLGQRFKDGGYKKIKPLIKINDREMILEAIKHLPNNNKLIFILRANMEDFLDLKMLLENNFSHSKIVTLDRETSGQATTAYLGSQRYIEQFNDEIHGVVTFGTCDSGVIYNKNQYIALQQDLDIDIIVWGIRGYKKAIKNPNMFSWVDEFNSVISKISVKEPIKNTQKDAVVLGIFTFKNINIFKESYKQLIEKNSTVNGEFYIDSCINEAIRLGYKCQLMEVETFLSWGTPDELDTYLKLQQKKNAFK